jgi:hypothetical protein
MFTRADEYLGWLRTVWASKNWEHLPGYSRLKVADLAQRYSHLSKPEAAEGLLASFASYHDEVLEPWIGSAFFGPERPRIGVYLREYPLPCLDRKEKRLRPGHGGTQKLPVNVMGESIQAVLDGSSAYKTLRGALDGALKIVQAEFGLDFEDDLEEFAKHTVFADWVRPFAMFMTPMGDEFPERLSKSSWHRREMYEFGSSLFAEEIGTTRLNLDIVIVMGLGMFEYPAAKLKDCTVWPPRSGRRFMTLTTRPASWPEGSRKVLVLPHPAVDQLFNRAVHTMTDDGRVLESSTQLPGLRLNPGQEILLEWLTAEVEKLCGDSELFDLRPSNYSKAFVARSFFGFLGRGCRCDHIEGQGARGSGLFGEGGCGATRIDVETRHQATQQLWRRGADRLPRAATGTTVRIFVRAPHHEAMNCR